MENKKNLIIVLAALAVLLVGGSVGYGYLSKEFKDDSVVTAADEENEVEKEKEIELAKDFTVYNKDGEEVKLSDYTGLKPVVVNFWASWCPPCKAEMPYFQNASDQYGEDVEILMVNLTDGMREKIENADQFMESEGYQMKVVYDTGMSAAATYRVSGIPRSLFVNIDGELVYDHVGMITQESLDTNIEKMIKE